MPLSKPAKADPGRKGVTKLSFVLHDLDRVKLKQAVTVEATSLRSGLEGTVVLCHGSKAYEVEFDGIEDFFAMEPGFLEKTGTWRKVRKMDCFVASLLAMTEWMGQSPIHSV